MLGTPREVFTGLGTHGQCRTIPVVIDIITRKKAKGSMRHIKDSINLISGRNQLPMPFGMKYLDKNLGGLYPGELTVICGDPDCGKTALMIRQIHRLAIEEEIPVIVALHGGNEFTFLACMAAYYSSIITYNVHQVYDDSIVKDDVEAYWHMLEKKPVFFMDSRELTEDDGQAIKRIVADHGIKAIFIEHTPWLCVRFEDSLGYHLKSLARELQVAVIAEYELWWGHDVGMKSLDLLREEQFSAFADNIIGIIDFVNHYVDKDENGKDLRGFVMLKIMKHKGSVSSGKAVTFKKAMLFSKSQERATLLEADAMMNDNPNIKAIMDRFDCDLSFPRWSSEEFDFD